MHETQGQGSGGVEEEETRKKKIAEADLPKGDAAPMQAIRTCTSAMWS